MTSDDVPDLDGKVVAVQLPVNGLGWTLLSPRFERQGGKLFLVGKPLPSPEPKLWESVATVCIPWRYIGYYVAFDSIDAYRSWGTPKPPAPPDPKRSRFGWLRR